MGGSSVALGIGFIEPSCKVNMHKGFIEFNPNKVAGDKRFHGLLKTLGTCVSKDEGSNGSRTRVGSVEPWPCRADEQQAAWAGSVMCYSITCNTR